VPTTEQVFSRHCLKALRERAGFSRTQLAFHLDRSEQAIYLWEVGRTQPTPDMLGLLATVLGCAIDDLFAPLTDDDPPREGGPSKSRRAGTRRATQP
jgi:transcriptional regulator with XRE-family HTH domain